MKTYNQLSSEEFLRDKKFRAWLISGEKDYAKMWSHYMASSPDNMHEFRTAVALFRSLDDMQRRPLTEKQEVVWSKIQQELVTTIPDAKPEKRVHRLVRYPYVWLAAACVLLLSIGIGWYAYIDATLVDSSKIGLKEKEWERIVNTTLQPLKIGLDDGSTVILMAGSNIRHLPMTDDQRLVELEGEGFFEVAHDTTRPFIVFANRMVVKVVGTSFWIDAKKNQLIDNVRVRTGKVMVCSRQDYNQNILPLLLTANEQVQYDTRTGVFAKIEQPGLEDLEINTNRIAFNFDNSLISEVFLNIEKAYGVRIIYDSSIFGSCRITVPLTDEPLFEKLDVICQTIGATYEVWGRDIVINGKGCIR